MAAQQGRVAPVGVAEARPATVAVLVHHRVRDQHRRADRRRARRRADLRHSRPRFGDHRGRGREDFPVVLAIVMLVAVTFVIINLRRRRHLHDHRSTGTPMTQPMDPTITESPMAVQQAAVVADDTIYAQAGSGVLDRGRVVRADRPCRDPRALAADQGPGAELHRPQPRASALLTLVRVLVRHRRGRPRHVLAHDLGCRVSLTVGFVAIACGMLIGGYARRFSPATSADGGIASCRSCSSCCSRSRRWCWRS